MAEVASGLRRASYQSLWCAACRDRSHRSVCGVIPAPTLLTGSSAAANGHHAGSLVWSAERPDDPGALMLDSTSFPP